MFMKVQRLLFSTLRWTSPSFSSHCQDSLSSLLKSSSIRRPKLRHISNPVQTKGQDSGIVAAADEVSLSGVRKNLRQSQKEFSARSCSNFSACAMESKTSFARELWEMNQKEAFRALYHPFVVAMAAGTLPSESFRHYIAQDVFFLAAFAEAYGLAMNNTDDQQAKEVLRGLQHHVREELDQLHMSTVQSFGFQLPSHIEPNSATTAYTKFLLAVAKGDLNSRWVPCITSDCSTEEESDDSERKMRVDRRKLAAFTMGALTPCMRLYAFLGQEIKGASTSRLLKASPYEKWVETYASADFEAASLESEKLLHKLASPLLSGGREEQENVKSFYRRAMELEVDFFAAQTLSSNKAIVPLLRSSNTHFILISDFDLTCTVEDSCSVLANLVMSVASDRTMAQQLESKWLELGAQYSLQFEELLDRLLPSSQQKSEEYSPQRLRDFLKELSAFEGEANARLVQSEFMAGLSMEAVKQAGSRIPFHQGCEHLLTKVPQMEKSLEFHILSVCWSRSLIQGSFSSKGFEFANIHSNELQFSNLHLSDGNIDRRIESAVDKEKVFEKILSQAKVKNPDCLSIYIGDSVTDLLCLLQADIGIVIGQSSSLDRVAAAFGIKMLPLYTGLLQREQQQLSDHACAENQGWNLWAKFEGVLYRVSTWNELNAFLFGS